MSNLLITDVFESYYEGRKTPFTPTLAVLEGAEAGLGGKRDQRKPKADGGKSEQPLSKAA